MSVFENVINEANKKNEVNNVPPESVEVADEGEGKKSFIVKKKCALDIYLQATYWLGLPMVSLLLDLPVGQEVKTAFFLENGMVLLMLR